MKCLYIYNPYSGKSKAEKKKEYIVSMLSQHFSQLEVVKTERPGHAKELAEASCGQYDYLVVAGGDGTLNEVVNGLAEKDNKPILGYIPLGTVNDFAHSVGIPRSIKGAIKTIISGTPIQHEIFKAGERYGVYVCAMGVGTSSSYTTKQKVKKKLGKSAYFLDGFFKLFNTKTIPLTIEFEGGKIQSSFGLMLAINSKYVASFKLNKNFRFNDGYVDFVIVEDKHKKVKFPALLTIARLLAFGIGGKHAKRTTRLRLKKFTMTLPKDAIVNLDGEGMKFKEGKFDFEVIQNGLQIIVKNKER